MTKAGLRLACMVSALFGLSACGERPQTAGTRRVDQPAYTGVAGNPGGTGNATGPALAGWKAGDASGWEAQMRTRAQGQNEYSRASGP